MNVYWHTMRALLTYNRNIADIETLSFFWLKQNVRCHRRSDLLDLSVCSLKWLVSSKEAKRIFFSHVIKNYKSKLLHSFECIFLHISVFNIHRQKQTRVITMFYQIHQLNQTSIRCWRQNRTYKLWQRISQHAINQLFW